MHQHYHELLPYLPYIFSLCLYASLTFFLIKGSLRRNAGGWRGGGGSLKSKQKLSGGGGVKPISIFTLKKSAWFFEQQIEFFVIRCLAVAKVFLF